MEILKGTDKHLQRCAEIAKSLRLNEGSVPENGALVDYEIFRQPSVLAERELTVAVISDKIVGFLLGFMSGSSPFQDLRALSSHVKWDEPIDFDIGNYYYMYMMGVDPEHRRQGIGSALYKDLTTRYPETKFVAAIIEAPFQNLASAQSALTYGFRRVGVFEADEFEGIKGYKSGIYLKNG